MTKDEQEYIDFMSASLPPIIARKAVKEFLGGIVCAKTLSNADYSGTGPEIAYQIGRHVAYKTDSLLAWVVKHYGVQRKIHLNDLGVAND